MFRLLVSLILSAGAAVAQTADDVVRVDVLPGWRQADGIHMAGLRMTLAPGWKTYWRYPGEAGIPPRFDWSGSRNLGAASTAWPTPQVFTANGYRSIGYSEMVVLPLALRPSRAGENISLRGRIEIGVCQTVCIPVEVDVAAELDVDATTPDATIRAALSDVPQRADHAVDCALQPIADGMRLTATVRVPRLGGEETAVVEFSDPEVWVSEVETSRSGGALVATAELVPPQGAPFALDRSQLRFTVLGEAGAVDIRGCSGDAAVAAAER
ncbi:protein-disulfide reductase DsbD domain-containing protein [Roseitranquillus sediminis]|uniref:protein-disulfide reductase DsbD domain-containing protein n=1 Tax=Roseitranquillus sediminis TaxID=2809051 RepID=UPI001D0C4BE9|nr:protein-disulfide reductase DsbD domain-containing protein [Roseitranquillus sediminis]MBM9593337.1 hypothetical protein [Roseitranquillus sediminis]